MGLKNQKRELRNKSTLEEKILWQRLRKQKLGLKFHRQYGIGPYILDFYCPKKKLGIELDGKHHSESKTKIYDKYRSEWLSAIGITILRFWNSEISDNIDKVIEKIGLKLS